MPASKANPSRLQIECAITAAETAPNQPPTPPACPGIPIYYRDREARRTQRNKLRCVAHAFRIEHAQTLGALVARPESSRFITGVALLRQRRATKRSSRVPASRRLRLTIRPRRGRADIPDHPAYRVAGQIYPGLAFIRVKPGSGSPGWRIGPWSRIAGDGLLTRLRDVLNKL